ncbi:YopX family protein [Bacillus pumilus]|uniref:YopX family protein n=1 Tax=Bacillus pumilus TaxID=1408 RepID=UPI002FFFB87C
MRDIKLRAWDNVENKMLYLGEEEDIIFSFDGSSIIATDIREDDPNFQKLHHLEYMQFTGLKDCNGVEIYEGDILKSTVTVVMYGTGKPPEDIDEYLEVQYREEYAGFFIGERSLFAYVDTTIDIDTRCSCTKAEVVGNIYKNPELLI